MLGIAWRLAVGPHRAVRVDPHGARMGGARHVAYGVRAADYQTVGDALFAALAAVLGDGFDAQTREAWMLAYNIVAETMLEGAAAARPIGS